MYENPDNLTDYHAERHRCFKSEGGAYQLSCFKERSLTARVANARHIVQAFTQTVEQWFEQDHSGGLITLEKAEVIRYKAGNKRP